MIAKPGSMLRANGQPNVAARSAAGAGLAGRPLLTEVIYSQDWYGPFCRRRGDRASDTAAKRDPEPVLDALPPAPSTALLSAEEAKERLREIVEGFFFRRLRTEDGKAIRRLLVKSPPGLGKTRQAVHWAICYREGKDRPRFLGDFNEAGVPAQTSIFVPRHQLAEELREVIQAAFRERDELITVPILRGRENGGEAGKAPCRRRREARELGRKGLPIYTISASAGQTANGHSAPTLPGVSTSRPGRRPTAPRS